MPGDASNFQPREPLNETPWILLFYNIDEKREYFVADYGFPKKSRLLTAAEYKAVFSAAQFKVSCRYFLILAIKNNWFHSRLGLVIAKKNVGKATQRNRVKRMVREFFRLHCKQLIGLDLVVLARKDVDTLANGQLSRRLGALWKDLGAQFEKSC